MSDGNTLLREQLLRSLSVSGERDRLKEHLRTRLIECGWREQVRLEARHVVETRGVERVQLQELVDSITPRARTLVPDVVKKELLTKIKDFLANQQNI